MATGGSEVSSDEIINIKCCVCAEENRTKGAEKYCMQCKDYYCSTCIGMHKMIPSLRDHTVLDKSDFGSMGPDDSLPSFPTKRCHVHRSDVVNVYCKDHDVVVCALCVALYHRSCQSVHSVSDDIDNLYNTKHISNIKQQLTTTRQTLEKMKEAAEGEIVNLRRALKEEEGEIKAFKANIQILLDEMEQRSLEELRVKFNSMQTSLTDHTGEVEKLITTLSDAQAQVNNATGNRPQEFVIIKLSEELIANGQKIKKQKRTGLNFVPDSQLLSSIKSFRMLGKVFEPKQTLYNVQTTKEINVKVPEDQKECWIYGSCITEDRHLLLTDVDNKRLKRVDLSTDTVKDCLDFPAGPIAVCRVRRAEVAVTLQGRSVNFVSLGDKMKIVRSVSFQHHCSGLDYIDENLFISDGNKTVYIHNLNGQELMVATTNSCGENIFENARHITVNPCGDRVFVADNKKGVIILDKEGNYLSSLNDIQIDGCHGICTDGRNLLVCGWDSKKIVQIDQDYNVVGQIAAVTDPFSVAFDHKQSRLIVTRKNGSNTITMLELE